MCEGGQDVNNITVNNVNRATLRLGLLPINNYFFRNRLRGESFVVKLRNTRSKVTNILFQLVMTIFNFLKQTLANKLLKFVYCLSVKLS